MKKEKTTELGKKTKNKEVDKTGRRKFLKTAVAVGAGAAAAPMIFNIRTAKAKGQLAFP